MYISSNQRVKTSYARLFTVDRKIPTFGHHYHYTTNDTNLILEIMSYWDQGLHWGLHLILHK